MSKEEFRSLMKWVMLIAVMVLVLALFTRKDLHGPSKPVWKSFTTQEKPTARH
jgi:hypothetical protein